MRDDIIQIVAVLGGSLLLVAGLVFWLSQASQTKTPELLQNSDGTTKDFVGPYSTSTLSDKTSTSMGNDKNPVAVMKTNKGTIELELFADKMPITTSNFIKLAKEGFYDGTKFHRVISGFMIQGGDPNTKGADTSTYGTGGPGYTIQDEFVHDPELSNVRGTIAMANTGQPNSGGSQFFINTADNTFLDFDKEPSTSKHPVFGKVINGMDVVDTIEHVKTGARDMPVDPVVVESVVIKDGAAAAQ